MDVTRFHTENKFRLFVDLRSTEDKILHGAGLRLVNSSSRSDGPPAGLEIWTATCSSSPMHSSTFWMDSSTLSNIEDGSRENSVQRAYSRSNELWENEVGDRTASRAIPGCVRLRCLDLPHLHTQQNLRRLRRRRRPLLRLRPPAGRRHSG